MKRLANTIVPVKPDVDNVAKLLLDCLSGILYVDDAQVVDLHIFKLRDNEGLCTGRVGIHIRPCTREPGHMIPDWMRPAGERGVETDDDDEQLNF